MMTLMSLKKVWNAASFALFLGTISACLAGCPVASTGTSPAAQETSGGSTSQTSQIQDQPSLPGGVVVMENDPTCDPTIGLTEEAEDSLVCQDSKNHKVQVHLSGRLKGVSDCFNRTHWFIKVVGKLSPVGPNRLFIPPHFINIPLDADDRFDLTFWAPSSSFFYQFGPTHLVERGDIPGVEVVSPFASAIDAQGTIRSMLSCSAFPDPNVCALEPPSFLVTSTETTDSQVALVECGAPDGAAVASLVCQNAARGTVQVHLTGQLKNVNEEKYPKDRLYLKVVNENAAEAYSIAVDDQYRFDSVFEAHAPLRFDFAVSVVSTGVERISPRPGVIFPMNPCSAGSCFLEGDDRMEMNLQGDLTTTAEIVACAPPAVEGSAGTSTGVYQLAPSTPSSNTPLPGVIQIVR